MGTKTELGASVRSALKGPSLQAPFPTFFWFFISVSLMNFFPSIVVTLLIHIAEAPFFSAFSSVVEYLLACIYFEVIR